METSDGNEVCELIDIDESKDFDDFITDGGSGIKIIPEKYGDLDEKVVKSEMGSFSKWIKVNHSEINIDLPTTTPKLVLRSNDYWMPLVFLASDITLSIYLNLVASYIYDRVKGSLKGEKARVHLEAHYKDDKSGVAKAFKYEGNVEGLKESLKKFNLDEFMD